MNYIKEARMLVNYIQCLDSFEMIPATNKSSYTHIGALFTDIVLQAGMNYNTVVKPRVKNLINNYPQANTVSTFNRLIKELGLSEIINWRHFVKLQRIYDIIAFSDSNQIETCQDMLEFLRIIENRKAFLKIDGFGPKTLDYTLKLLSYDTVAVDRHIFTFVEDAGINSKGYFDTKMIVEYAADFMEVSRTSIDISIWKYMSNKNQHNQQTQINFILD